jgi:STE24 endopeptidase
LHAAAALVVVLGVAAQLIRPLAPDLGPPPPPADLFDAAFLARAAAFRQPLYVAAVVALLIRVAIAVGAACTGPGRRATARVVDRIGRQRPARAACAVVLAIVVTTDLVLLPLVFWAGFVHRGDYGLHTQSGAGWLRDWAVYQVPVWLGLAALVLLGVTLVRRLPNSWAPVGGLCGAVLAAVVTFASPLILEPLSNQFTPLEPGPVRTQVEAVLAAAGEDVGAILVADASRRGVEQNAYVSGVGASKRLVLFDTLVQAQPPAEIGVVVAHELAHRRHADLERFVALTGAAMVTAAYVLRSVLRRRILAGRQDSAADPYAAPVVLLVALLLNLLAGPVESFVSRRAEAAADLGALEYTGAPDVFERMERALTVTNLSEPQPPRAVELWTMTHPSTMARVGMARWWERR